MFSNGCHLYAGYTCLKHPSHTVLRLVKVMKHLSKSELNFSLYQIVIFLWLATKMSLETSDLIFFGEY